MKHTGEASSGGSQLGATGAGGETRGSRGAGLPKVLGPLWITAAAVEVDGQVFIGRRHNACIAAANAATGRRVAQEQQGFIASNGRFYDRNQAAGIAYLAGQTEKRKSRLYSEDVWR